MVWKVCRRLRVVWKVCRRLRGWFGRSADPYNDDVEVVWRSASSLTVDPQIDTNL